MLNSKKLREQIAACLDRAQAIVDLASEENRDLTAEEKAEIDGIQGFGKIGEDGYKPGEAQKLEADLVRMEKLEARQASLLQARTNTPGIRPSVGEASQVDQPRAAGITIPIVSRFRHGSLKAFRGQHADESAYISGMFLLATIGQSDRARQWCSDHGVDVGFRGALRESSNDYGGYLVPTEMEQAIIALREEYGVFRREADVVPMGSDTKTQPKRSGGVTAYFPAEAGTITASDPSWTQVSLTARKIAALVAMSREVSEDAIVSIADKVADEIAYAFAKKEDECGFIGDGTSTYGGIVGIKNALNAGSVYTADTGDVSFETLDMNDFEACIGKLPLFAHAGAKWYISQAGYAASMLRLLDAAGGNTMANLVGSPTKSFLGYPVVISQVLNSTLGSDVSVHKAYFGNLKMGAMLGNRRGLTIDTSTDVYFATDQIAIKGTARFDINVHERGTASVAGAIVALKTAAS